MVYWQLPADPCPPLRVTSYIILLYAASGGAEVCVYLEVVVGQVCGLLLRGGTLGLGAL